MTDISDLPPPLLWLKDAPLLIDEATLASYYDAVVRPPHTEESRVIKVSEATKKTMEGKLGAKGTFSLAAWLAPVFDAKAEASAEAKAGREKSSGEEQTITLAAIHTPQRQLEQLTIFYAATMPSRLFLVSDLSEKDWRDNSIIAQPPRALAFLDLPAGTKLIPTAAEFMKGTIVTFFDKISADDGRRPPAYPSRRDNALSFETDRLSYWKWYSENYRPQQMIDLIEEAAAENGPINWIDYRIPLSTEGETLHIHVSGRGNYHTGTYAYYMVRRAYEFGLRLVGTLKTEPDMNVLAVYEK